MKPSRDEAIQAALELWALWTMVEWNVECADLWRERYPWLTGEAPVRPDASSAYNLADSEGEALSVD